MSDEMTKKASAALTRKMQNLADQAHEFIEDGIPENTRRAYRTQWANFVYWCNQHGKLALPTDGPTLVLYLTDRSSTAKLATLNVALSAISVAHREAGYGEWKASEQPGVKILLRGMRRKKQEAPVKKQALRLDDILRMVPAADEDPVARALILVGYFAALRRSEIMNLKWENIFKVKGGLKLRLWASKTDKENVGQDVFLPEMDTHYCPVKALLALNINPDTIWVFPSAMKQSNKPISATKYTSLIKKYASKAGINPDLIGGHSFRSGFVTQAAEDGAEERDIMKVTRHRSTQTVRGYIQEATFGDTHPGKSMARKEEIKDGTAFGDYTKLALDVLNRGV